MLWKAVLLIDHRIYVSLHHVAIGQWISVSIHPSFIDRWIWAGIHLYLEDCLDYGFYPASAFPLSERFAGNETYRTCPSRVLLGDIISLWWDFTIVNTVVLNRRCSKTRVCIRRAISSTLARRLIGTFPKNRPRPLKRKAESTILLTARTYRKVPLAV